MSHFHNSALIGSSGQGSEFKIERSLRFNNADSAYLSRTPSSAGNRKTWTWSGWVKRTDSGTDKRGLFGVNSTNAMIRFNNDDGGSNLRVLDNASGGYDVITKAKFRDPSAWYHFVVSVDTTESTAADRVKIYVNGVREVTFYSASYPTQNQDLTFNTAAQHNIGRTGSSNNEYLTAYLADVHFIDGQALAPTDFGEYDDNNVWQPKAYSGSYGTNGFYLKFADNSSTSALGTDSSGNDNTWTVNNLTVTTPTVTTSSITSATAFNTNYNSYLASMTLDSDGNAASYRSGTTSDVFDNSTTTGIRGAKNDSGDAEIQFTFPSNLISVTSQVRVRAESRNRGVALIQATIGGTTTSYTWQNIGDGENRWYNFSGTGDLTMVKVYNNNDESGLSGPIALYQIEVDGNVLLNESGTDLEFTNNTNFSSIVVGAQTTNTGSIVSKNGSASPPTIRVSGGTWSTGGTLTQAVIVGDDLKDSPMNSTDSSDDPVGNYATLNSLTRYAAALANGNLEVTGNRANDWSLTIGTIGITSGKFYWEYTVDTVGSTQIGICQYPSNDKLGVDAKGYGYILGSGRVDHQNTDSAYGNSLAAGDILGIAYDADGGNLYFYKNGTIQNSGTAAATGIASATWFPGISIYGNSGPGKGDFNFGQAPFNFTLPSGYKALCTQNLADPTIAKGSTVFDTKLYTGTGSNFTVTYDFSPDLAWIKGRSYTSNGQLSDTVRSSAGNKRFELPTGNAEDAGGPTFVSTGLSLGTNAAINTNNQTYVSWAWDAGSSTVSNSDGSITSNVRANTSAGFSIVSWSGNSQNATVGHGLGAVPKMIIHKRRNGAASFITYHEAIGNTNAMQFNASDALINAGYFDNKSPTSTIFNVSDFDETNRTGSNYIAYCFTPIEGYSAFGSYEGTGSSPGPFVYTGFRPAFLLYKNADAAAGWQIYDSSRDTFNQCDARLQSNSTASEDTTAAPDILSNGFKLYATHTRSNANNNTYLYAAFAEHPFKTARAR